MNSDELGDDWVKPAAEKFVERLGRHPEAASAGP